MARDEHWRQRLPVDRKSGEPLAPRAQPGYYPGFSTLGQQSFWDAATRQVVVDRVEKVPPIRFFSADEAQLMAAVLARVLPQDDRDEQHRIPILNFLDQRLFEDRGEGYRYASMPPDGEAHRLGLGGIDAEARARHGRPFLECTPREQETVLAGLHDGKPATDHDAWRRMPAHRYFLLLLKEACEVYYAHPYAWDEIGFGGPAYPRGYFRLEHGEPEPWEVKEQRYGWEAPPGSPSGEDSLVGGTTEHHGASKGGTH